MISSHVQTTSFNAAWERLRRCHQSVRKKNRRYLRLLGVSGVGKSFLAKKYKEAHPNYIDGDATIVTIVHFSIPSNPSKKQMYQAFLRGFGITSTAGDAEELKERAEKLCKSCKVELILIDEIHHFIDRGSARTYAAAADALKELIESLDLPVVLIGAPRSQTIFLHNSQLRSRVTSTCWLTPFTLANIGELMGFVYALTCDLPEPTRQWIASQDIATRIFFATDGIHRNIARLIAEFEEEMANGETANMATLSKVFREHLWPNPGLKCDPFRNDFKPRRLNMIGEPYEPSPLDGDNHGVQIS
ncbi:TniB family NTP-binding protein [Variovorax paradoxus]|uniref:TniB family NTP-binding protein n=1 Tax=Variovorax paradoxus TaxID=34073 RepID=UPI003ECC51E8